MEKDVSPHPGAEIWQKCIGPAGLTIPEAARGLGISQKTLAEVVDGQRGISPEIAIRLSKAFGGSAESWLTRQMRHDLSEVQKRADKIVVRPFEYA